MTQALLDVFVDAFLAEQGRYEAVKKPMGSAYRVRAVSGDLFPYVSSGTRAECTRWIAREAARKAFAILQSIVTNGLRTVEAEAVYNFLRALAAEPETTSGDAVGDHVTAPTVSPECVRKTEDL